MKLQNPHANDEWCVPCFEAHQSGLKWIVPRDYKIVMMVVIKSFYNEEQEEDSM